MKIQKATKWLCENASRLERFAGQWVLFSVHEGLVSKGESLPLVMRSARRKRVLKRPFVFHVPSRDELKNPFPAALKK